jgi:IstB-like ATP binding protein
MPSDPSGRSADDPALRARVDRADVEKGFEEWGEIFGDEVMAAALIDRLVHHCHLVTIRGNSYRMRQHTELWQTLHAAQEPEPASRRRRARQEVATS